MNNHAKRCMKTLEALGFQRDYEAKTKGRAYRHPNQPDQMLKVFDAMDDSTITSVIRKANKIADTGWSGPRQPETIRERARIADTKKKSRRERDDEARQNRAADAECEYESRQREIDVADRRREIESLMQPGRGR